jgi:uncharacterized membrane protein YdjX (TVP38/TMEM64 family)
MDLNKLKRYGTVCVLASALLTGWLLFALGGIDARKALLLIQAEAVIAPAVFVLLLLISTLLLLPLGLGLNLGAGIVWGALLGGALTTVASLLAAIVAFLLSRRMGDRYLKRYLEMPQYQSLMTIVRRHDWKLLFLVRLNPIIPFGLQNYLFGLTGMPLARYAILSLFACAIPSFLYAAIGESINNLVLTGAMTNVLKIGGLILLAITLGYVAKLYARMTAANTKS